MHPALTHSHAGSIFPDGDALARAEGCDLLKPDTPWEDALLPECAAPASVQLLGEKMGLVVLLMGSGDKEGLGSSGQ